MVKWIRNLRARPNRRPHPLHPGQLQHLHRRCAPRHRRTLPWAADSRLNFGLGNLATFAYVGVILLCTTTPVSPSSSFRRGRPRSRPTNCCGWCAEARDGLMYNSNAQGLLRQERRALHPHRISGRQARLPSGSTDFTTSHTAHLLRLCREATGLQTPSTATSHSSSSDTGPRNG
jgi:hypothetical protein